MERGSLVADVPDVPADVPDVPADATRSSLLLLGASGKTGMSDTPPTALTILP